MVDKKFTMKRTAGFCQSFPAHLTVGCCTGHFAHENVEGYLAHKNVEGYLAHKNVQRYLAHKKLKPHARDRFSSTIPAHRRVLGRGFL